MPQRNLKTRVISIRVTEEEYIKLVEHVQKLDALDVQKYTMSQYIRELIVLKFITEKRLKETTLLMRKLSSDMKTCVQLLQSEEQDGSMEYAVQLIRQMNQTLQKKISMGVMEHGSNGAEAFEGE